MFTVSVEDVDSVDVETACGVEDAAGDICSEEIADVVVPVMKSKTLSTTFPTVSFTVSMIPVDVPSVVVEVSVAAIGCGTEAGEDLEESPEANFGLFASAV